MLDQRNVVLVGGTGAGMSHLAVAIVRFPIRTLPTAASSIVSIWSTDSRPGPSGRQCQINPRAASNSSPTTERATLFPKLASR